ncbi:hypothetical protein D3C85_886310 [compost metagenome]
MGIKANIIRHIPHLSFHGNGVASGIVSTDNGFTIIRFGKSKHHQYACRLSSTVRAEQTKYLTPVDVQAKPIDCLVGTIAFAKVPQFYNRFHLFQSNCFIKKTDYRLPYLRMSA